MNYEFCDGMTHTIKKGDTLYSISRMHDVPIAMIMRANPYVDVYNLRVGDTICIPVMPDNMQQRRNNDTQLQNDMQGRNSDTQLQNGMQGRNSDTQLRNDMQGRNSDTQLQNDMQGRNSDTQLQNDMQGRNSDTQLQNDMQRNNSSTSVQNGTMTAPAMSDIRPQEGTTDNTSDSDDICESGMSGEWARYVSQPGDTLQDIMDRSESSNSDFWIKNSADRVYLLPGIAYYVYEKEN